MTTAQLLAKQIRDFYVGKNWTWVWFKEVLADVTLEEAKTKIQDIHTILALTYHIHYYLRGQLNVLKGGELEIKDAYAFDHPDLQTEEEWQAFQETLWVEMEEYASLVAQLSDAQLNAYFVEEKYGTYFRIIQGAVEHGHYHLGQIVILKKLIRENP